MRNNRFTVWELAQPNKLIEKIMCKIKVHKLNNLAKARGEKLSILNDYITFPCGCVISISKNKKVN